MNIDLYPHQIEALKKIKNGSILAGGVGSGKSRTALAYYYISCDGEIKINGYGKFARMKNPRELYIITTAKKRDTYEWEAELVPFVLDYQKVKVTIDSWNNIKKYQKVYGAFFIFDEQRLVGSGAWVRAFYKIAKKNRWILLSATPGDEWKDYIPVFIANGFYTSKRDFAEKHIVYRPFVKYPIIQRYIGTSILEKYREEILVPMMYLKTTERHYEDIEVNYNKDLYKIVNDERWNPYDDEPIDEVSKLFYLLRRVCNEDLDRIEKCKNLATNNDRVIIFYNFNYELDLLIEMCKELEVEYKQWNGHSHESCPESDKWVYLVQYSAGSEGWNCITTNVIIFYSLNYSYRIMEQASGRIDRLNTKYKDLYYYRLISKSSIDQAINSALGRKKIFNEKKYYDKYYIYS